MNYLYLEKEGCHTIIFDNPNIGLSVVTLCGNPMIWLKEQSQLVLTFPVYVLQYFKSKMVCYLIFQRAHFVVH